MLIKIIRYPLHKQGQCLLQVVMLKAPPDQGHNIGIISPQAGKIPFNPGLQLMHQSGFYILAVTGSKIPDAHAQICCCHFQLFSMA